MPALMRLVIDIVSRHHCCAARNVRFGSEADIASVVTSA